MPVARPHGLLVVALAVLSIRQATEFDGLLARLADARPDLRQVAIEQYLNLVGRVPVVEGDTAVFLVEGAGKGAPRIVGDFNGGGEPDDPALAGAMTRIDGTDWYYLRVRLPRAARLQYRIALDGREAPDPRNPIRVESSGAVHSELRMPGYLPPVEIEDHPDIPHGRVESVRVESRILDGTRDVHVYLPAGYDAGGGRYPVAYFGDGTIYVRDARVPQVLDHAIAQRGIRETIAVLVEPVNRRDEYRANPDYRRFVVDELIPFVDRTYRTLDLPEARVVAGSSRGALAAIDLAFHHPERFAFCIALSPAIGPAGVDRLIADAPRRSVRFHVVGSLYDAQWLPDARRLRDVLTEKGYALTYIEIPEGHDIRAWRARIDDALADVFGRPSG